MAEFLMHQVNFYFFEIQMFDLVVWPLLWVFLFGIPGAGRLEAYFKARQAQHEQD